MQISTNKSNVTTSSCDILQQFNAEDILLFLINNDMIDSDGVTNSMRKSRKEKIIKEYHPYAITESKDGSFRTWIKDDTRPEKRRQIVRTKYDKLIDYLVDHYSDLYMLNEKSKVTMRNLFDDWIKYKSLHVQRTTIERIKRDWKRYYNNASIVDKPLHTLSKLDIDEWIHGIIKELRLNKHQYANLRLIINQELDYAVDREIIAHNPFKDVKVDMCRVLEPEHKKPDNTQVYSKNELEKLIDLAWFDFDNKLHPVHQLVPLAVMFMFFTGLRIGEVCGVRYEDINGDILTVKRMTRPNGEIVEKTKGTYGERKIPLVKDARKLIEAAKNRQHESNICSDGFVFSMKKSPVLYSSVQKAFYKYCKDLGIRAKSSHKARKTFASALIDANINVNTVREYMGHKDEKTTLTNYVYDRSTDNEKYLQLENALLL